MRERIYRGSPKMLISVEFCDFYHCCVGFPCLGDICPLLALVGVREDGQGNALNRMNVFLEDNLAILRTDFCKLTCLDFQNQTTV